MRTLARTERISRYKLHRLLTAAGVKPAHITGKTIYFDLKSAHEAIQRRTVREVSAVSLRALASRTGVSIAILARKVRHGCIQTIGNASHAVDEQEARRIEDVVCALRSPGGNLQSLGICRWYQRGRAGLEVISWDIPRLIGVAQRLSQSQQLILFDQAAWLCEGAGQERFRQALDHCCLSQLMCGLDDAEARRSARVLLRFAERLPRALCAERNRLALIASGATRMDSVAKENLRAFAHEAGCRSSDAYERFLVQLEQALAELFTAEQGVALFDGLESLPESEEFVYPDDEFVSGAIVVSAGNRKPAVGVISRVEHQAWNALAGTWDKTVAVRFAEGERRINPYARKPATGRKTPHRPLMVLLSPSETISVCQVLAAVRDQTTAFA
jgi:hypothetical protein